MSNEALALTVEQAILADKTKHDYVEVETVKPRNEKSLRISKVIRAKNTVRRNMVNNSLSSWGEWRVRSSIKTPTKTYDADNEVISDGHDHALLSDFDSDMIVIDTAIDKLNPVDRRILELEYKREYRDPVKQWCYEFGRATNTYKNRLSALLINSSIIIACNAC